MDKSVDKTWEIALTAVAAHAWLAIPLVIGVVFVTKFPELVREYLSHRREIWKMKSAEQHRREAVEHRRQAAERRRRRQ